MPGVVLELVARSDQRPAELASVQVEGHDLLLPVMHERRLHDQSGVARVPLGRVAHGRQGIVAAHRSNSMYVSVTTALPPQRGQRSSASPYQPDEQGRHATVVTVRKSW